MLKQLFWELFNWQLLEETFEQTKDGMMVPNGMTARISVWVRPWDKETIDSFHKKVTAIEAAGFVAASKRYNAAYYM